MAQISLLSMPSEVVIHFYITLVCPDEEYDMSVTSLAATCGRLWNTLCERRIIWTEMFAASFDLLEHHAEFDIMQEYKKRRLAFRASAPVDSTVFNALVFENQGRNVRTLAKARRNPKVLSSLSDLLATLLTRELGSWVPLAVFEELVNLDIRTARAILTYPSVRTSLHFVRTYLGTVDIVHCVQGYVAAQAAHLSVLELLVRNPPLQNIASCPAPRIPAPPGGGTVDIGHALTSLTGVWRGYYTYENRFDLDGAMCTTLFISEGTNGLTRRHNAISAVAPKGTRTYKLHGEGSDRTYPFAFVIDGFVWSTGEVNFTKLYVGGHSWVYSGRLLPWGIAGTWNYQGGGSFWIWKDGYEPLQ